MQQTSRTLLNMLRTLFISSSEQPHWLHLHSGKRWFPLFIIPTLSLSNTFLSVVYDRGSKRNPCQPPAATHGPPLERLHRNRSMRNVVSTSTTGPHLGPRQVRGNLVRGEKRVQQPAPTHQTSVCTERDFIFNSLQNCTVKVYENGQRGNNEH